MKRLVSEIIQKAELTAQIHNTDAIEWRDKIDLINQVYVSLYQYLHQYGDRYFEKEFIIDPQYNNLDDGSIKITMPDDFFMLQYVGYKNGNSEPVQINRAPNTTQYYGGYRLINDYMEIRKQDFSGPIIIRYIPKPIDLTYPVKFQQIESIPNPLYSVELSQTTPTVDYMYGFVELVDKDLMWMDEYDVSSVIYTIPDNAFVSSIIVADPYIFINLNRNRHSWVECIQSATNIYEFNPDQFKGSPSRIKVLGMDRRVDDTSGKGLIIQVDYNMGSNPVGNIFLGGYVPDTCLEYPNNTFFDAMIYDLAIAFRAILDMPLNSLPALSSSTHDSLSVSLSRDNYQSNRINNVYNHREGWGF